jgi:hypothetical protein
MSLATSSKPTTNGRVGVASHLMTSSNHVTPSSDVSNHVMTSADRQRTISDNDNDDILHHGDDGDDVLHINGDHEDDEELEPHSTTDIQNSKQF